MEEREFHERRKIFKEELKALKDEKYIDEMDYNRMNYAYQLYVQQLDKKKQNNIIETDESMEATDMLQNAQKLESQLEIDPMKELIQKLKTKQQQEMEAVAQNKLTAFTEQKSIHRGQGTDEMDQTEPAHDLPKVSALLQTKPSFSKPEKSRRAN